MRHPAMHLPVAAHYLPTAFGFAASGCFALVALVTETTWLAAGTFVVTAGGVLKMLYQMRIDSLKDTTAQDLRFARMEVETLKAEIARLGAAQERVRQRSHDNANEINAIRLEQAAARVATPDPDRSGPMEVIVRNDQEHPVPTAPQPPRAPDG